MNKDINKPQINVEGTLKENGKKEDIFTFEIPIGQNMRIVCIANLPNEIGEHAPVYVKFESGPRNVKKAPDGKHSNQLTVSGMLKENNLKQEIFTFEIPLGLLGRIVCICNIPEEISDHAPVYVKLEVGQRQKRGPIVEHTHASASVVNVESSADVITGAPAVLIMPPADEA